MSHLDVARAEVPSTLPSLQVDYRMLSILATLAVVPILPFFRAYHICSLRLILLKDVLFIVRKQAYSQGRG